jgi:hypothetical protein
MTVATRTTTDDFLRREYLPVIRQFPDGETQQALLRESAVTRVCVQDPSKKPPSAPVSDNLPKELAFLAGSLCDLGFGRLDLPPEEIERLYLAFCGQGVAVPGTPYKLRHSVMSLFTFVEPATGHEAKLPADWRQVVRSRTWIGKKVAEGDLAAYEDKGDGYFLREASGA